MRTAFLIAKNGLLVAARDKKALILTLLMPLIMTAILGNALKGVMSGPASTPAPAAIADSTIHITEVASGARPVSAMQYYAVAIALMFILTGTIQRGATLLEEREIGTMQRMLTSPIARGEVLAGQALGSALLALVQCFVLMVGTRLIFGVTWGNWGAALALGTAYSLAAAGIGGALAGILKDKKAMSIASGTLSNVLGLISGALVPLWSFPKALQLAAHFTPNYWAMQGFLDQMAGVGGGARLWLPVAVLGGIALVTGAFGTWRMAQQ